MIPASRVRGARWAVSALFMANGAMWAHFVPRLPEIRERLDVSYTVFGVAIAVGTMGGITLGALAAKSVRRFGSAHTAAIALALQSLAVFAAATSHSVWAFAAFLFLNGALDANTDVAQNAQGMGIQRMLGRSIINGLHAMWSAGAALGGVLGSLAVKAGLGLQTHALIATCVFVIVAAVAWRTMLDRTSGVDKVDDAGGAPTGVAKRAIPRAALFTIAMLGLVAVAGVAVEDAGMTWSSSYLKDELGVTGSLAGMGLIALMTLHFVGRLAGDRLVDRFGERAVARTGGVVTAVGMGVALAWPHPATVIAGFALAGLGVATTVPAAFAAADAVPGLRHGTGITMVSWFLRLSFLVGPPIVGAIGDTVGLRAGLVVVPLAGLAVVGLARFLEPAKVQATPATA